MASYRVFKASRMMMLAAAPKGGGGGAPPPALGGAPSKAKARKRSAKSSKQMKLTPDIKAYLGFPEPPPDPMKRTWEFIKTNYLQVHEPTIKKMFGKKNTVAKLIFPNGLKAK